MDETVDSLIDEIADENMEELNEAEIVAYEQYIEHFGETPKNASDLVEFARKENMNGVTYDKSQALISLMMGEETVATVEEASKDKNQHEQELETKLNQLTDSEFDILLDQVSNHNDKNDMKEEECKDKITQSQEAVIGSTTLNMAGGSFTGDNLASNAVNIGSQFLNSFLLNWGNYGAINELMTAAQNNSKNNRIKSDLKCVNGLHTLCKELQADDDSSEKDEKWECSKCGIKTFDKKEMWICDVTSNVKTLNLDGNDDKLKMVKCKYNICQLCFEQLKMLGESAQLLKQSMEYREHGNFEESFNRYVDVTNLKFVDFYTKEWENGDLIATAVTKNNLNAATLLLNFGANVNNSSNDWKIEGNELRKGETLLFAATRQNNFEMCKLLLQHGANPNIVSVNNVTLFVLATQSRNVEILKLLIQYEFDYAKYIANCAHSHKINCLRRAAHGTTFECLKYICQLANLDKLDINYDSTKAGLIDIYQKGLNDTNLLYFACDCETHNEKEILLILNYLFDNVKFEVSKINEENSLGMTCMHMAAAKDLPNVLKLLYEKGGNINKKCSKWDDGRTPLFVAVCYNSLSCVEYLVNNQDCDVNATTNVENSTPLSLAVNNKRVECVKILAKSKRCKILTPNIVGNSKFDLLVALAVGVSNIQILQVLCHEILKKHSIETFDQFEKLQLFGDINHRKATLIIVWNAKNYATFEFLTRLYENGYGKRNIDYIKVMFDYENDSMAQKQIENDYFDMLKTNKMANLLVSDKNGNTMKDRQNVMDETFAAILKMIQNTEIINDLLLFIANKMDQSKLMDILKVAISQALAKGNHHNAYKYCWYKECLLFSKIWSLKQDINDNKVGRLLFDEINDNVINKELIEQQMFIKEQIESEMKSEPNEFAKIIKFSGNSGKVRQLDRATGNGSKVEITPIRYSESQFASDVATNFNTSQECDFGYYLTKLLISAHNINDEFQTECQRLLCEKFLFVDCQFTKGSVKKRDRCLTKTMTDYWRDDWPKTASLVDLIRCSVVFNNCKDMLVGLNNFGKMIERNESQYIKAILRTKNMFEDNMKDENNIKYGYCDIKLNVLFEYENVRMVGEIQFLLNWMLDAKKLGHSLYGFSRNVDYSNELSDMYFYNDKNDSKMKQLSHIIATNNFTKLQNIFLYQNENELLKMANMKFNDNKTLWQVLKQNNFKKGYEALAVTMTKCGNNNIPKWDAIEQTNVKEEKDSEDMLMFNKFNENYDFRMFKIVYPQNDDEKMSSLMCSQITMNKIDSFHESCKYLKNEAKKSEPEICKIINLHENGYAFYAACRSQNMELIELFLEKYEGKSNINYKCKEEGYHYGYTPLLHSTFDNSYQVSKLLLDNGANVNEVAPNGTTALIGPCLNRNLRLLNLVTDKKYNCQFGKLINLTMVQDGISAIFLACEAQSEDVFKHLLKLEKDYKCQIDFSVENIECGSNVLSNAVSRGHAYIVEYLLTNSRLSFSHPNVINKRDKLGRTALYLAAAFGQLKMMKLLIKYGADVNISDQLNRSPLYAACLHNQYNIVNYLVNEYNGNNECEMNTQCHSIGASPLAVACVVGHFECVKILCQCDRVKILDIRSPVNDSTILEQTILGSTGDVKIVQYLYQALIKRYNIKDFQGIIKYKIMESDSIEWLLKALISNKTKMGSMYPFLMQLLERAIKPKNFQTLMVLIDWESNSIKKQRIDTDYVKMNKNFQVANTFVGYLKSSKNTLNYWNEWINNLIRSKEPIDDCLLFMANIIDQNKLIKTLKECISDCISKNKNERDYAYFKECLLHSSLWAMKPDDIDDDNSGGSKNDLMLFDIVNDSVINPLLTNQQLFIKNCILSEINNNETDWKELCENRERNIGTLGVIRQDRTIYVSNEENIMLTGTAQTCEYEIKGIVNNIEENWNGYDEYNFNGYLTQLLLIANNVNYEFQNDCSKFFNNKHLSLVSCHFTQGTIKTKERSMKKTITDYLDRGWPQCANILDFVRCSVSFDSVADLVKCLNRFEDDVGKSGFSKQASKPMGCLTKIVRIKNGFKNLPRLYDDNENKNEDMSKYTYADIKVNVLIECRGNKMIGEVQFLLNWMLKAKKLGHTLYGFSRNRDYMLQLSNLFYPNLQAKQLLLKQQIPAIAVTKNLEKLEKMLLYQSVEQLKQLKQSDLEQQLIDHKWKKGLQLYKATLKTRSIE